MTPLEIFKDVYSYTVGTFGLYFGLYSAEFKEPIESPLLLMDHFFFFFIFISSADALDLDSALRA